MDTFAADEREYVQPDPITIFVDTILLKLATRGSPIALQQSNWVKS
jgi:hypothetical protein